MTDTTMRDYQADPLVHTPSPDLPPPGISVGLIGWMRHNLFSSPMNSLFTVLGVAALYYIIPPIVNWAIVDATISGTTREGCDAAGGACWTFVKVRFWLFMYGFYPEGEWWRVNLSLLLFFAPLLYCLIETTPGKKWVVIFLCLPYWPIAGALLLGGFWGMPFVDTTQWSGFSLTLIIAVTGISFSLPLGILLALGRRSDLPVLRMICVGFIEFIRAVPLISILFMSTVILPLFMPEGVTFDKLMRALIGVTLFSAAYMAETVRGGLQAIPNGQYEAADAMGLTYWQSMRLIVLPQALKIVIPALVSSFIGLFKDTTLVLIIGLVDLVSMIQSSGADIAWAGYAPHGYVFAALLFFVFCFSMSRYSMYLEDKLHTGHKR